MEGLLAGVLLLLLVRKSDGAPAPPSHDQPSTPSTPSTTPGGQRDIGKDIATGATIGFGVLTGAIEVAKDLGIIGGTAGTAAGAGGAGAGTAGAATAPTLVGPSTTTATGATATGSSTLTTVATSFWASGAGGALTFLAIAAAIISIVLTQKQNAYDKEFHKKLGRGKPNARSLVDFEVSMLEKIKGSDATPIRTVRDVRLDVLLGDVGYQSVRQGQRPIYQTTQVLPRRIRSMAYAFIQQRHLYTYRLRQHWAGVPRPTKTQQQEWSEAFNDPIGWANVPLLNGFTRIPRVDPADPFPANNDEQLQPLPIVLPGDWSLEPGDRIIARLLGLLDAISTLNNDSQAYIYLDSAGFRREHRDRVFSALELTSEDAEKVDWVDSSFSAGNTWRFGFILKASKWGLRVRVDCDDPKRNGISHAFLDNLAAEPLPTDSAAAKEELRVLAEADAATIPASPNNSVSNIR